MVTALRTAKLTFKDYLLIPEDGKRHELIGGEHFVTAAPTAKHQIVVSNLMRILGSHAYDWKLGRMLVSPLDVIFSDEDVVQPDLLFVARGREGIADEKALHGAPDLAIEVLSPSTRRKDLVLKRLLYERTGVVEYWIVDPKREAVQVYRITPGGLRRLADLSAQAGDSLESALFPGLSIPLDKIFE
jgi:Uma2 family endonuclease